MPYRLEDSPGFAIYRTDMRLRQVGAQLLRPYDLTPEQFAVLATLCNREGMSQGELAADLIKDRPNITRILDKLQAKGWVERRLDTEDRRVFRVYATKAGRCLLEELVPQVLALRRRMFGVLSDSEQATLCRLLDRLFASLE